jgi:uncharacterized repeat protein (TIGR04076 family)
MKNTGIGLDRRTFLKASGISGASLAISCGLVSNVYAATDAKGGSLSTPNPLDDAALKSLREMLRYNDEQWEAWKSNPRNFEKAMRGGDLGKYKLVAEVVSAYGCGAGHKVGDKIVYLSGNLSCKESSEQICAGLLSVVNPYLNVLMENVFNGNDPTKIAFNMGHCPDVGVNHGGWGEVIVKVSVEKVQA